METFPFFLKYPFTQVGRVGRRGRPDNTRLHNYMTRTDVELTLPDSHAKCVGARPLYDAKRGTTNPVNSTWQQQQQQRGRMKRSYIIRNKPN